jgi:hypothetical protein
MADRVLLVVAEEEGQGEEWADENRQGGRGWLWMGWAELAGGALARWQPEQPREGAQEGGGVAPPTAVSAAHSTPHVLQLSHQPVISGVHAGGRLAAAALNLVGTHALFGRNWGCLPGYSEKFLHYELCYYSAIEHAIEAGMQASTGRRPGCQRWGVPGGCRGGGAREAIQSRYRHEVPPTLLMPCHAVPRHAARRGGCAGRAQVAARVPTGADLLSSLHPRPRVPVGGRFFPGVREPRDGARHGRAHAAGQPLQGHALSAAAGRGGQMPQARRRRRRRWCPGYDGL